MFKNITKKLKISANVILTVGIIFSCICLMGIGKSAAFLLIAIISFFSIWFTSILIYAFAELLEHTKAIRENVSKPTDEQISIQEEL